MEKILDELSNLRLRHQQLLSQISEPQNQETIIELQFLIEVLNIISSDSKLINNIVQSIPKMRNKGYAHNEEDFPSKTLERLDKIMMRNNIILYIKNHTISPTISSVHEQLTLSFQNTLKGKDAPK